MFCIHCGKAIQPGSRFCPHCGSGQAAAPSLEPAPEVPAHLTSPPAHVPEAAVSAPATGAARHKPAAASGGKTALWAGGVALMVALAGGAGYWGWSNKVAGDEAAHKRVLDEAARKLSEEEQRRQAAEKAAEAAEVAAAQAMLDKHIAAEEAEAQARGRAAPAARRQAQPKAAPVPR